MWQQLASQPRGIIEPNIGSRYIPEEAPNNMLKQPSGLGLDKLGNHVAQNSSNCVEALISSANVVEAVIIKEYLLHNEDSHRLAKLGASLHDAQAERDDFSSKEEVNHLRGVILDQGTNNTQAGQTEILEWARLGCGVEEWIEEEGDMSYNQG
jgi:hypothetical protein